MIAPDPEAYEGPVPNYFVIGGPKCGTSTLCNLLGQHPDVFMSDPKEPHFFGRNVPEKTWQWYLGLFENAGSASAVGEGSTSYTHPEIIEDVAQQLRAFAPDARLIYIVRHPLKRIESDWRMRRFQGWAASDINDAVLEEGTTLIGHSRYWSWLVVYRRYFPDDQILVLFLEDLVEHPAEVMARCFKQLKVTVDVSVDLTEATRNQSDDFRMGGPVFRALRKILPRRVTRRFLPAWMRRTAVRLMTRRPDLSLEWIPEVRASVVDELREESERLLRHCAKPRDFWRL